MIVLKCIQFAPNSGHGEPHEQIMFQNELDCHKTATEVQPDRQHHLVVPVIANYKYNDFGGKFICCEDLFSTLLSVILMPFMEVGSMAKYIKDNTEAGYNILEEHILVWLRRCQRLNVF